MELMSLKRKMDGYRDSGRSIRNVPPELLLELRQTWEHYTGSREQFRSELGIKTGTLRKLLQDSKKLNHVIASAGAVGIGVENGGGEGGATDQLHADGTALSGSALELVFDHGSKVIRFPSVDLLIEFMRKAA